MALRIPAQRANGPELPERAVPDTSVCVHGLETARCGHCNDSHPDPAASACAVEGCTDRGYPRYFPTYRLTLCFSHWIQAADRHRIERTYW